LEGSKAVASAVIDCNLEKVEELVSSLVKQGLSPAAIIDDGLIAGMNVVGERFKTGEMYLPEVMMAAKAVKSCMNMLKPLLKGSDCMEKGIVVLGTVAGDKHDIGKNLVGMIMESSGFTVIDLGVDVVAESFIKAIREFNPHILGLSALLTTTMKEMKTTIDLLTTEGLRDSVKVIVGGAPVTGSFADSIGADGWAPDAASAKDLIVALMLKKQ